ncbi:MAG: hypothetical protein R2791_07415 [Saprospiraceae bacterium]
MKLANGTIRVSGFIGSSKPANGAEKASIQATKADGCSEMPYFAEYSEMYVSKLPGRHCLPLLPGCLPDHSRRSNAI